MPGCGGQGQRGLQASLLLPLPLPYVIEKCFVSSSGEGGWVFVAGESGIFGYVSSVKLRQNRKLLTWCFF